jgi:hypothetical protein
LPRSGRKRAQCLTVPMRAREKRAEIVMQFRAFGRERDRLAVRGDRTLAVAGSDAFAGRAQERIEIVVRAVGTHAVATIRIDIA